MLRIKILAQRAYELADERTQAGATTAVILTHESIEWLLRHITQDWNAKEIEGVIASYREKFKENKLAISELNNWSGYIERLRLARNTVLHMAIVSENDATNLCGDGIELIRSFLRTILNIDYDALTYSSLIKTEKFKQLAMTTESAYRKGDYRKCIEESNSLVSEVLNELASVAGEVTGTFTGRLRVHDDNYADSYTMAEARQLAQDLHDLWLQLGLATTTQQFLSIEEKIKFLRLTRLANSLDEASPGTLAAASLSALDFATSFAYKAEAILRNYSR